MEIDINLAMQMLRNYGGSIRVSKDIGFVLAIKNKTEIKINHDDVDLKCKLVKEPEKSGSLETWPTGC